MKSFSTKPRRTVTCRLLELRSGPGYLDPRGDVLPTEAGPTWTLRTTRCSSNVKRTHERRALSNVDRLEDTHGAHPAVRPYGALRR